MSRAWPPVTRPRITRSRDRARSPVAIKHKHGVNVTFVRMIKARMGDYPPSLVFLIDRVYVVSVINVRSDPSSPHARRGVRAGVRGVPLYARRRTRESARAR